MQRPRLERAFDARSARASASRAARSARVPGNAALRRLIEVGGSSAVRRFVLGYVPVLPPHGASHSLAPYVRGEKPSFYPATYDAVLARTKTIAHADPSGTPTMWARCGACNHWGVASEMHIGHQTRWLEYLDAVQPATKGEAAQAYNDLDNLRLEHGTCNTSHAWEEVLDGADWDELDGDALRGLAEYLEGTGAYGKARAAEMREFAKSAGRE